LDGCLLCQKGISTSSSNSSKVHSLAEVGGCRLLWCYQGITLLTTTCYSLVIPLFTALAAHYALAPACTVASMLF
jgi:hypothetical protein